MGNAYVRGVHVQVTDLRTLRNQWRNLKADSQRKWELQFARESAVLDDQIRKEVWRLRFEEGMSIRAIGELYGTKNWGTINAILQERPVSIGQPEGKADITYDGETFTITKDHEKVRFTWDDGYPIFITTDPFFNTTGDLATELRKANNAYEAQIRAISEGKED